MRLSRDRGERDWRGGSIFAFANEWRHVARGERVSRELLSANGRRTAVVGAARNGVRAFRRGGCSVSNRETAVLVGKKKGGL